MEWNPKSLGQWDLEHLFFFNIKATENPKFQPFDWSGEADQEINFSSGCSESELILASSSRSSKSASNNSSSNVDSKTCMFTLEGSQDGSTSKKEEPDETSPAATEPSSVSGEPLLTLKLGKRLYFENFSTGSDSKKPSSYEVPISCGKKCKTSTQNMQKPSCQIEGCGLDLSSAKDYHRKHRVCESHSKSPKVVIAGLERRFCQQCSRFHALSEFDDKKRSCKRRLLDHNARRRKPQPEAVQFNQSALSSSLHDISINNQRQRMSPFLFSRTATTNLAWQNMHNSKHPQTKDFLWKPEKAFNNMPSILTMLSDDSNGFLTSKGIATKSIGPDLEHPNATQDGNGALSLLSTNSSSWSNTYETKSLSLQNSIRTHNMPQSLPLSSLQYWHAAQQPTNSSVCISSPYSDSDNSNRFQEFQLLNAPYESSGFSCKQLH